MFEQTAIKILLVDDDKDLLRMAYVSLKHHYEVTTAFGGEDALKMIDEGLMPDVVLLDIDMPGMDGFETFCLMRERQALEYVPIVFLTSLSRAEDKAKGLDMGAVDYLTKPFESDVMARRILMYVKTALERRKLCEIEKNGIVLIDEDKFARFTSRLNTREKDVARFALLGRSNPEIGKKLSYSNTYVKKLMQNVFDKLGVNGRDELKQFFAPAEKPEEVAAIVVCKTA